MKSKLNDSTGSAELPTPTIIPLGERIIIDAPPQEKPSNEMDVQEGIIVPDGVSLGRISKFFEAVGKHHTTKALAVGEGCKLVKAGDRIVVTVGSIFYVNSGGIRFCASTEAGVVAVVN